MPRIAFVVSYDGTNYAGFQIQPQLPTIQGELERALSTISQSSVNIVGSGRTDAGVHAFGQVIHFDTSLTIPLDRWPFAIKNFLPEDIVVRQAYEVPDRFHARYDAIGKVYRYELDRGKVPNVFYRRYRFHYPHPLNMNEIRKAIPHLMGTHDFSAFSASGSSVEDRIRTIYDIQLEEREERLTFTFYGNGFLYNMVRILVGTLLEVGNGKIPADRIPEIVESRDRKQAGVTVPPQGLTLMRVEYPPGLLTT